MPVLTETTHPAEFIISEANGCLSRDAVTISATNLLSGTVLGQITANSKYVILAPGAADGSQTAKAVLIEGGNATAGDLVRAALTRLAEINAARLIWPAAITAPQKAAAITQLAAAGVTIIVR